MTDKSALGDRMKAYEAAHRYTLPPRTYSVIRLDGRAFHSYLRHATKPFDLDFLSSMDATTKALCEGVDGTVFAYTQSDEISLLVTDFGSHDTLQWFGGTIAKMVSVSAAIATAEFNLAEAKQDAGGRALFDSRVFTLPNAVEVANYFLWRQRDAVRNSIAMAAQACFSQRQLHGVNTGRMQEMLWSQKGINWNDYDPGIKRGRVCVRRSAEREVTYTDKRTQAQQTVVAMRSWWEVEAAPHFTARPDGWLAGVIPAMPHLALADDTAQSAASRSGEDTPGRDGPP